jgi:hypothetical protein
MPRLEYERNDIAISLSVFCRNPLETLSVDLWLPLTGIVIENKEKFP